MLLSRDALRRLCHARDVLVAADGAAPTIRTIARTAGISPFHFIRVFESVFGATPHQLRTHARLDRAKQLLAEGHSVTETCMEIGFSSLGSFSALFHRRIGRSPSAYARRARSLVQVPGGFSVELFPGCLSLLARLPAEAFRTSREARGSRARHAAPS